MTDLLIKFPSRERPAAFTRTFAKWDVPGVRFLVSLDDDDPQLHRYVDFLDGKTNVRYVVGRSEGKIHAVNRDLEGEAFSVCIVASDDMVPQTPKYAERICELMAQHFPDGDGVLHLNDGRVGRRLNTSVCCDWKYFKRFSYLYHPSYRALWSDNEWQDVSEKLGRAAYVDEVLVAHEWVGSHSPDDLHRRNEAHYMDDAKLYQKRRAAGFPVNL